MVVFRRVGHPFPLVFGVRTVQVSVSTNNKTFTENSAQRQVNRARSNRRGSTDIVRRDLGHLSQSQTPLVAERTPISRKRWCMRPVMVEALFWNATSVQDYLIPVPNKLYRA